MKKVFFILLFAFAITSVKAQTLSNVLYPRTPYGQSIEAMYVDTTANVLYIGGNFTSLELPPAYTTTAIRKRIAAIDLTTGQLLPWTQSIDDGIVYTIEKSGDTIFAGGNFNSVNSSSNINLVSFDSKLANTNSSPSYSTVSIDTVKCMYIANSSIYVGGAMNLSNPSPTSHLIEMDRATGSILQSFPNTISLYPDYFINVSKIQLKNTDLYFIAEVIDPAFTTTLDKSIFHFDLTNPGSANYLIKASFISSTSAVPKIDDFAILNNKMHIIGNFNQLIYGNNISINKNKTACYNLTSNLFESWSPAVSSNAFLAALNYDHGIKSSHIIPFKDWIFLSEEYSTTINSTANANGSILNFTNITGAPALNSVTNNSGEFFFDMKMGNNSLVLLNRSIYPNPPSINYVPRNNIHTYCLQTKTPSVPVSTTNTTTCCRLAPYTFYVPNAIYYSSIQWSYSGTGATITNNGNDTITIQFSLNATPGNLTVYTINTCGQNSSSVSFPISLHPAPTVFAGKDTSLNCTNGKEFTLYIPNTSTNSYSWYNASNTPIANNTIIHLPGTYIAEVTDNNGCKNYDTLQIGIDTIPPVINVNPSYIISKCNPPDTLVLATTNNITDSIYWTGTISPSNPAILTAPKNQPSGINYTVNAIGKNGCSSSTIVNVVNTSSGPTLYIPPGIILANSGIYSAYWFDTLTCIQDSALLNFTTNTPGAKIIINRPTPYSDSVSNNIYVKHFGLYIVYITDTTSGCSSKHYVYIHTNKALPTLTLSNNNPILNCSNSTVSLNAQTSTLDASLGWSGPNNFSSLNPATANQTGIYTVTVTHPLSGCTISDSVNVIYLNTLDLNSTADTLVCKGASLTLTSSSVGGTPPFNYSWSNSAGNVTSTIVSPNNTTSYIVTIADAAGCIGTDTINVNISKPITDSTASYAPCDPLHPNGQIQIFAHGGIPPYQYSLNNAPFQFVSVFDSLDFGSYTLVIKDFLNCTHSYIHTISNQSLAPKADFIVSTTMMQADTFVVVDISNPRPDTVIWTFPASVTVINNNIFAPVIISSDTGIVFVTMQAQWGTCVSSLTKQVQFIKPDTLQPNPNGNGIESIIVFPNPNSGQFSVEVKLYKKQTFAIYIYNAQGIEQTRSIYSENDYGLSSFSLPNPTPGTYLIKVVAEFDSKSKTFMVTQ